jgi:hypothetical protein
MESDREIRKKSKKERKRVRERKKERERERTIGQKRRETNVQR